MIAMRQAHDAADLAGRHDGPFLQFGDAISGPAAFGLSCTRCLIHFAIALWTAALIRRQRTHMSYSVSRGPGTRSDAEKIVGRD
jgi:hypothetical protein